MEAYNAFLQTGRVEDYLKYVEAKQQAGAAAATGDDSAYYNRWNCSAGAGDA